MTKKPAAPKPRSNQVEQVRKISRSTQLEQPGSGASMSGALREYIESLDLGFREQAADPNERRSRLRAACDAGTAATILQGYWLEQIHQQEGNEAFLAACAEAGIGKSAGYNARAALEIFNRLPDLDTVRALGRLEPTKLLLLRYWDDAELKAFARGEEARGLRLEAAVEETVMSLSKQQREWQQQHDLQIQQMRQQLLQANTRAEVAELQLKAAHARLDGRADRPQLPEGIAVTRAEAVVLTESAVASLLDLEQTLHLYLIGTAQPADTDDALLAAAPAYHAIAGVAHQAMRLLTALHDHYGDAITGGATHSWALTGDELDALARRRAEILRQQELDRQSRSLMRQAQQPRKPGRPRKVPS